MMTPGPWRLVSRPPTSAETEDHDIPWAVPVWMVVGAQGHTVAVFYPDEDHDPDGSQARGNAQLLADAHLLVEHLSTQ